MRNVIIIRKILLTILFSTIILYAFFQAEKLISGPKIEIYSPKTGSTYSQMLIEIEGRGRNIAYINMNDKPIYTDKTGYFKEKFLLSPGYNVIKIDATDKFKKYTEKRLEIVLKEH